MQAEALALNFTFGNSMGLKVREEMNFRQKQLLSPCFIRSAPRGRGGVSLMKCFPTVGKFSKMKIRKKLNGHLSAPLLRVDRQWLRTETKGPRRAQKAIYSIYSRLWN